MAHIKAVQELQRGVPGIKFVIDGKEMIDGRSGDTFYLIPIWQSMREINDEVRRIAEVVSDPCPEDYVREL